METRKSFADKVATAIADIQKQIEANFNKSRFVGMLGGMPVYSNDQIPEDVMIMMPYKRLPEVMDDNFHDWLRYLSTQVKSVNVLACLILYTSCVLDETMGRHNPGKNKASLELYAALSDQEAEEFAEYAVTIGAISSPSVKDQFKQLAKQFDPYTQRDALYDQWKAHSAGKSQPITAPTPYPSSTRWIPPSFNVLDMGDKFVVATWQCHKCKNENNHLKNDLKTEVTKCSMCNVARSWQCQRCFRWNDCFDEGDKNHRGTKDYCGVCSTDRISAMNKELWK